MILEIATIGIILGGSAVSVALVLTGHWLAGFILFIIMLLAVCGFKVRITREYEKAKG